MLETATQNIFKYGIVTLLSILYLSSVIATLVWAASVDTTLSHTIGEGVLSIAIVDAAGDPVVSPSVSFAGGVTFSFSAQNTTGTLGTASEKIRVTNATSTPDWDVTIAAKSGPGTQWTTGTYTHPFDSTGGADTGRLTVDPSVGTLTPMSGCSGVNISKGTSNFFLNGTTDSITLLSAGVSAQALCYYDFTGVALTQRIPAEQEPGVYTIDMTLTVL